MASLLNSSVAELRSSALEGVARIGRALAQDHDGALDGAAGVLAPYVVLLGTPIALATKERNYRIRDSAHSALAWLFQIGSSTTTCLVEEFVANCNDAEAVKAARGLLATGKLAAAI